MSDERGNPIPKSYSIILCLTGLSLALGVVVTSLGTATMAKTGLLMASLPALAILWALELTRAIFFLLLLKKSRFSFAALMVLILYSVGIRVLALSLSPEILHKTQSSAGIIGSLLMLFLYAWYAFELRNLVKTGVLK